MTTQSAVIRVAHSPDADDAFMFWAMAAGKIDTQGRRYAHELEGHRGGRQDDAGIFSPASGDAPTGPKQP